MYMLGPPVIVFALIGWASITYDGVVRVLPLLAARGTVAWWCYVATTCWLFFNVYFNYLACVLRDPGCCGDPQEIREWFRSCRGTGELAQRLSAEAEAFGLLDGRAMRQPELLAEPVNLGPRAWVFRPPFSWGYCRHTGRCARWRSSGGCMTCILWRSHIVVFASCSPTAIGTCAWKSCT